MNHVYIFVTALFSALILVPVLCRWGLETGKVDKPDARKVHSKAVPRLGGIAIFLAFLCTMLLYVEMSREVRGLLAGGVVIFLTGLLDDLHGLSARSKFIGQLGGCLLAATIGNLWITRLGDLFGLGTIELPLSLAVPFTLFATVGLINAMNLIDGLDGLAGGISAVALGALLVLANQDGNLPAVALSVGLLGALLGFLKYNFFPARIFMGDAGSLTVGYLLAFLAIMLTQTAGSTVSPVLPVLILGLPIVDTVWVMSRRMLAGTSPFVADRTHVHHQFLDLGLQHRFTVIVIYSISFFWALASLFWRDRPDWWLLTVYLLVSTTLYLVMRYVSRHRERFGLFSKDSSVGLRKTTTYLRLAALADHTCLPIAVAAFVYLGLTALFIAAAGGFFWQLNGLICLCAFALLFLTRDAINPFLLAMVYVAGLVLTLQLERQGGFILGAGWSLGRVSDLLFVTLSVLLTVKIAFRRDGDFFISAADLLFFGLSLFFMFLLGEDQSLQGSPEVLLKGVLFYVALKLTAARSRRMATVLVVGVLGALLTVTLRGWL
ncbi:MAG TPA: hypothetical protein DCF93_13190 [Desulfuromonas sp.]|nr:hypothetical protein [Desulfuromonas sp.]